MKRIQAWRLLVERGVFPDRDTAERWIISGKVLCDEERVDKPGELVSPGVSIRVKGLEQRYVSRGGTKLEHALRAFDIDLDGKVALDCGASTGGFTDCLLRHGAARVYAVDAGYGQLAGKLRADPRVVNLERTNLSSPLLLELDPRPAVVTLDLSYLSLAKALPVSREILHGTGLVVALVKPLFEIDDPRARRSGVIGDRTAYAVILRRLLRACAGSGARPAGLTWSPVRGSRGTEEYFLAASFGECDARRPGEPELEAELAEAVDHWAREATGAAPA